MSGNEFLNPAVLATYRDIERMNQMVNPAISAVFQDIERMNQMVNPAISAVFQDIERMNQMVNPAISAVFQDIERMNQMVNPAISAVFQDIERMNQMVNPAISAVFQDVERMNQMVNPALLAIQESAARAEKALKPFLSAFQETARMNEFLNPALLAIHESPVMQAMREFSNLPFSSVVRESVFSELNSLGIDQFNLPEDQDIAQSIQAEIQKELAGNRDYNRLSKRAQLSLSYIYHKYFLPIILGSLTTIIMQVAQKVQISLEKKETPAEIKSYVRQPIPGINKNLLKSYRVVTGSDVLLRKDPSMKSDIITTLPRGQLLEVLDKSNRSWIFVKVEIEEEIFVGWVSRRYTTYFK